MQAEGEGYDQSNTIAGSKTHRVLIRSKWCVQKGKGGYTLADPQRYFYCEISCILNAENQ